MKKKAPKAPRRLRVKPPKVLPHGKDYDRNKQKKIIREYLKD